LQRWEHCKEVEGGFFVASEVVDICSS
jgi:hypothetical protein